jgi:predicted small integral membrane protein
MNWIGAAMIAIGYLGLIASFGWKGLALGVGHVVVLLAVAKFSSRR